MKTTGRQAEAEMLNGGDMGLSGVQEFQRSTEMQYMTKSKQCQHADNWNRWQSSWRGSRRKGDEANWHPHHSNGALWVSWSFLLQHLPFPFSYQISILSVTICRCHTNQWPQANLIAGCHSQTARHHTLTFKEKDPNRWLAPNTNNCIKPPNKVKKGSTLPSHEQQKQLQAVAQQTASRTSAVAPLFKAVMGSTGRLNINQVTSQVKSLL